jgi:integrase
MDFLTHVHAPLRKLKPRSVVSFTHAIAALSESLGRDATIDDITAEVVRDFRQEYRDGLAAMQRHAVRLGITDRAPLVLSESDNVRNWTVDRYFHEVMMKDFAWGEQTLAFHRKAIEQWLRFSRMQSTVRYVTQKRVDLFRQWLLDTGKPRKRANNMATFIRQLGKHAMPHLWLPRESEGDPEVAEAASDTLESIVLHEYLPCNPSVRAAGTKFQHHQSVKKFSLYLGHPATLDDLTDDNMVGFMQSAIDAGLSIHTANGQMAKVRALWTWLAKRRRVEKFPTVKKLKTPERVPDAWRVDDIQALIDACAKMRGEVDGIPSPLWWRTLYLVAFDSGERTGALLAMEWQHIDLEVGSIVLPAEIRKGGNKAAYYQLRPATIAELRRLRAAVLKVDRDRAEVFKFSKDHNVFYNRQRQLLRLAGIPYVKGRSGLQKVRRTFASYIEKAGGDATAALMHSSRATTLQSYIDPRVVEAKPANLLLPEIRTTAE